MTEPVFAESDTICSLIFVPGERVELTFLRLNANGLGKHGYERVWLSKSGLVHLASTTLKAVAQMVEK